MQRYLHITRTQIVRSYYINTFLMYGVWYW